MTRPSRKNDRRLDNKENILLSNQRETIHRQTKEKMERHEIVMGNRLKRVGIRISFTTERLIIIIIINALDS